MTKSLPQLSNWTLRRLNAEGQFSYYLRAAKREAREYGLRRGLRRFWVARWYWSAGLIGVVPNNYRADYWLRPRCAHCGGKTWARSGECVALANDGTHSVDGDGWPE